MANDQPAPEVIKQRDPAADESRSPAETNRDTQERERRDVEDSAKAALQSVGANGAEALPGIQQGWVQQNSDSIMGITKGDIGAYKAALKDGKISTENSHVFNPDELSNLLKGKGDTKALAAASLDKITDAPAIRSGLDRTTGNVESAESRAERQLNGRGVDESKDNIPSTVKAFEKQLQGLKSSDGRPLYSAPEIAEKTAELDGFLHSAEQNLQNPEVAKHLQGTPEQEMARVCKAMNEVMEGKDGPLKASDRANLIMGIGAHAADSKNYGNQGQHMTCALQSLTNNEMGSRTAEIAEQTASLANTGKAYVGEGKDRHQITINEQSRTPDFESSHKWTQDYFGTEGKRDMFGQLNDARLGTLTAELRTEREGNSNQKYEYFAAHAPGAPKGQDATGEGMVRQSLDANGKVTGAEFLGEGPNVGIWDVAELHQKAAGNSGFFVHENLARSAGGTEVRNEQGELIGFKPPAKDGYADDVMVRTFSSEADAAAKMAQHKAETGQDAQLGVNAPYLPGGGMAGHGLHAISAKAVDGKVVMDNQWGLGADQRLARMDANDFDLATNSKNWGKNQPNWHDEKFDPTGNKEEHKNQDDKQKEEKKLADRDKERLQKEQMALKERQSYEYRKRDFDAREQIAAKAEGRAAREFSEPRPSGYV